mgnify:CR=1 FL=1
MIESCDGQARWWDEAAAIFAECVDLSSLIGKVKFQYCPRSCNQAAHVLANYSFFLEKEEYPRPLHLIDAYGQFINY